MYDDETQVSIPRHASNSDEHYENTLEDGVFEIDLVGYESNVGAMVCV